MHGLYYIVFRVFGSNYTVYTATSSRATTKEKGQKKLSCSRDASPTWLCFWLELFVCLYVCKQDYSKRYG